MAFIATRGFLGTPTDVALRGFGIAQVVVPEFFSMTIKALNVGPTLSAKVEIAVPLLVSKINVTPR